MSDKDILRMLRENDARLSLTEAKEVARKNYGPTKPSSWPNNVPFFDATANMWVYYDGTRWLTVHTFTVTYAPWGTLLGTGVNASADISIAPLDGQYDYYVDRCLLKCFSTVAGTGLTNYHRIWFALAGAAYPSTYGVTLDTIAANTWTSYDGTPTARVWGGASLYSLLKLEKVLAPTGNVFAVAAIRTRLIVT